MPKRVAAVQSSYIPWKGYFDLIRAVDEFILLDDVQFTRRDWRSRNRIKSPHGLLWLTLPVQVKGRFRQAVKDTVISNERWAERHWASIRHCYARAPHFATYASRLEELYLDCRETRLSLVNFRFLSQICEWLRIRTKLSWSMDYEGHGEPTERLVSLCRQAGGTEYVSGPSARDYIDASRFERADIRLTYFDYTGYPEYPQLYPPFEHHVSIIDLLVHTGPDALRFMRAVDARVA